MEASGSGLERKRMHASRQFGRGAKCLLVLRITNSSKFNVIYETGFTVIIYRFRIGEV